MNWRELKDSNITQVAGAVSGGLDSCTVTHWLKSKGFSRLWAASISRPTFDVATRWP